MREETLHMLAETNWLASQGNVMIGYRLYHAQADTFVNVSKTSVASKVHILF